MVSVESRGLYGFRPVTRPVTRPLWGELDAQAESAGAVLARVMGDRWGGKRRVGVAALPLLSHNVGHAGACGVDRDASPLGA